MWNKKCFVILVITGATGIVNKGLKKSGNSTRKAFNRFSTKNSCTSNITHYMESASTTTIIIIIIITTTTTTKIDFEHIAERKK
jgi:hypothetical protein